MRFKAGLPASHRLTQGKRSEVLDLIKVTSAEPWSAGLFSETEITLLTLMLRGWLRVIYCSIVEAPHPSGIRPFLDPEFANRQDRFTYIPETLSISSFDNHARAWHPCFGYCLCFMIRNKLHTQSMNETKSASERNEFSLTDEKLLEYAQGWLALRLPNEANFELDRISPEQQNHRDVLMVRYYAYSALQQLEVAAEFAQTICNLVPDDPAGFINLAFVLDELKRTKEARDVLLLVASRFPEDTIIPYNLACYFCRLGDENAALQWLVRSWNCPTRQK
jgi:tetratricopeptide (TPR) repeat protein